MASIETAILQFGSKEKIKLMLRVAKKLGIKTSDVKRDEVIKALKNA